MATRKPTNIGKFNNVVDQLFDIAIEHCDNGKERLEYHKYQLDLARRSNPRLVVEKFMDVLTEFINQIMCRQEDFFLNFNFNDGKIQDSSILISMQEVWKNTDNQNLKDKIWKLLQLSLMYGVMVTRDQNQLSIINTHRSTPLELK